MHGRDRLSMGFAFRLFSSLDSKVVFHRAGVGLARGIGGLVFQIRHSYGTSWNDEVDGFDTSDTG